MKAVNEEYTLLVGLKTFMHFFIRLQCSTLLFSCSVGRRHFFSLLHEVPPPVSVCTFFFCLNTKKKIEWYSNSLVLSCSAFLNCLSALLADGTKRLLHNISVQIHFSLDDGIKTCSTTMTPNNVNAPRSLLLIGEDAKKKPDCIPFVIKKLKFKPVKGMTIFCSFLRSSSVSWFARDNLMPLNYVYLYRILVSNGDSFHIDYNFYGIITLQTGLTSKTVEQKGCFHWFIATHLDVWSSGKQKAKLD